MAIATSIEAPQARRKALDQWFYPFMAALFIAVAVLGFGPSVSMILRGAVPTFPGVWNLHGAIMAAWLVLFMAQALLMSSGRRRLHMSLGLLSFALAPAMVVAIIVITVRGAELRLSLGQNETVASEVFAAITNILLFAAFFLWAISARRRAPETHKRMLVMATFVLVGAGAARILWLPGMGTPIIDALYHLLLLVPALAFDLARLGRIHRAYLIGIGLYLPFVALETLIGNAPWWLELAPRLVGVSS